MRGLPIKLTVIIFGKAWVKREEDRKKMGREEGRGPAFQSDKRAKLKIQQNSPRLYGDINPFRVWV